MHDLLDRRVLTPLIAITLMQSAIVMSSYGITVVVPDAAGDIGIRPEWVGYLFATIYATASLSGVLSGRMIAAWGAAGAHRLMMAAIALGAFALMGATPLLAFLSAAAARLGDRSDEPRRQSCPCAHFAARLGGFYFPRSSSAPRRAAGRSRVFCFRRWF